MRQLWGRAEYDLRALLRQAGHLAADGGRQVSEWGDRFTGHAVNGLTDQLAQVVANGQERKDNDAPMVTALSRLSKVITVVRGTLDSVDPELAPVAQLTPLQQALEKCLNEANSFANNGNIQHLNNANRHADNVLQAMIPFRVLAPEGAELGQQLGNYQREIEAHLQTVDERRASLDASLGTLETRAQETVDELAAQKSRTDAALNQVQEQFATAEQARQQAVTDAEEKRQQVFAEAVLKREEEAKAAVDAEKARFDASRTATAEIAEASLTELQEHLAKAEKLVHAIGATGMVGGYQEQANDAQTKARFWRAVTVGVMAGIVGFAFFAFVALLGEEVKLEQFLGRTFPALCLGILAAFASKQAEKFDERERRNRQTELELASIDPYLVGLPEVEQNRLKGMLASRLFGQPDLPKKGRGDAETSGTLRDLQQILPDLKKLVAERVNPE